MTNNIKFVLVIMLSFSYQIIYSQNNRRQITSVAELKIIASHYNLEDIVSETLNTALQYATKEHAERFFKEQFEARETLKETDMYLQKTKYVHTISDRIDLVNSLPMFKKLEIQSFGGEENWRLENEKQLKGSYKIYRSKNGALAILPSKFKFSPEKEKEIGERLDNLPKE